MAITRPTHLRNRQIVGRAFGEDAQLILVTGDRNQYGEYEETEAAPVDIVCATAPPSGRDARVRMIVESGVRLDALRLFWTAQEVRPTVDEDGAGDIIVFDGQRWRAQSVQGWGGFYETLAVRIEGQ